jgi:hypothetical protein
LSVNVLPCSGGVSTLSRGEEKDQPVSSRMLVISLIFPRFRVPSKRVDILTSGTISLEQGNQRAKLAER